MLKAGLTASETRPACSRPNLSAMIETMVDSLSARPGLSDAEALKYLRAEFAPYPLSARLAALAQRSRPAFQVNA